MVMSEARRLASKMGSDVGTSAADWVSVVAEGDRVSLVVNGEL